MGLLGNIDLQSIQNTDVQSLQDNFPKNPISYSSNPLRMSIFPINPIFNPDTSFLPPNPFQIPLSTACLVFFLFFHKCLPKTPQIFPSQAYYPLGPQCLLSLEEAPLI